MSGAIALYILYFLGVLSLPFIFRGLGEAMAWAWPYIEDGLGFVARRAVRGVWAALKWLGELAGNGAEKTWRAFHRRRLGWEKFVSRDIGHWAFPAYMAEALEHGRAEFRGAGSWRARLRLELWAWRMRASAFWYGEMAAAFVAETAARKYQEEMAAQRRARVAEALRRAAEEEARQRARERAERERQERLRREAENKDPYLAARQLLKLAEHFTQKAFNKAYRKAMTVAHPDAGGTTQAAQAVNAARDLIRKRNGW